MKINLLLLILFLSVSAVSQNSNIPINVRKLMMAYPTSIIGYENGYMLFSNKKKIEYIPTQKSKIHEELLNSTLLDDIFTYDYPKSEVSSIPKNHDPGRIRNEELLKAMYGASAKEVEANLTTIVWCPKLVNQKIRVTRINGVDKQLQKISDELDKHPELQSYLTSSGGYLWRKISGTNRLSSHSFGTSIDIAVKHSNYWQWDCKCKDENRDLVYKNKIPQAIVDIFEKHGFIWGGKWYHYDTMHFEYRPELLIKD